MSAVRAPNSITVNVGLQNNFSQPTTSWVQIGNSPNRYIYYYPSSFTGPQAYARPCSSLCIPRNSLVEALSTRACLGISLINQCCNALGFAQNDVSIFRFGYLISMARNFAQMALAAERDFMQFKQNFENDTFELMNANHAVAISQANVRLMQLRVTEAVDQVISSGFAIQRIRDQELQIEQRLSQMGGFWSSWFGPILGVVAAAAASFFTAGVAGAALAGGKFALGAASLAGGATLTSGAATFTSSKISQQNDEASLRMQLESLRTTEYNAAIQNRNSALNVQLTAQQQARIAGLEAQFAAENANFLSTQFFNPQLWSFLAQEIKKNYRMYLTYGTTLAWLAQRALEFEIGAEPQRQFSDTGFENSNLGVNIIRFDYFKPTLQGLLGADSLLRDIATLENEKIRIEQRKLQITKVISLSATRPFLFAKFLDSGVLPFVTTLEEFDRDYPGHYQRRIKNVRINLFGLVGPEGIKATLTCLGISKVVVKELSDNRSSSQSMPIFVEKILRLQPETVALTSPQTTTGMGQTHLVPESAEILTPFEGHGVAADWVFELPKHSNKINYNTITDIQIVIDYTALNDPVYENEVVKRLPLVGESVRAFSFRMDLPDALFHLIDSPLTPSMVATDDNTTGHYTIVVETADRDFPPNENDRKIKDVVMYVRSKGRNFSQTGRNPGLKIHLVTGSQLKAMNKKESDLSPTIFNRNTLAELPPADQRRSLAPDYLGRWRLDQNGNQNNGVIDKWYIYFPPDENDSFLKRDEDGNYVVDANGNKIFDFSDLEDVIIGLNYSFRYPPIQR
jgi:hypothetical protein